MAEQKQEHKLEHTYSSYVRIHDDMPEAMNNTEKIVYGNINLVKWKCKCIVNVIFVINSSKTLKVILANEKIRKT